MLPERAWVLVADGGRARVLDVVDRPRKVTLVSEFDRADHHLPSRLMGDDRPGRVHESHGAARHAMEPRSDPHREGERRFAVHLAEMLDEGRAQARFDKLIIVVPPVMLGDVRKALSARVRGTVVAEIGKDLTRLPEADVVRHLEADLAS
ncbi:MAG: host attachment protein [Kofleriaceae bacterium]|nr:host attachment protein [Kofleriaceae bacterium]